MDVDFKDRLAVSQYLTKIFRSLFESRSISKKETAITMTQNITYDDPGMFITELDCDEQDRLIQDATIIWLINHLVLMSNEPQFYW